MKTIKSLCTIGTVLFLSSCSPATFYQVYNVEPVKDLVNKKDELFFEDENCKISYDLWSDGGNAGFAFYNKTDTDIYLKLNESYFILNGFAFDYFGNRTFSTSTSRATALAVSRVNVTNVASSSLINQSSAVGVGQGVSVKEAPVICIPPKTTKIVSEYSINTALIRNCDLYKFPTGNKVKSQPYTAEESPIVFSNKISYEIEGNSTLVENEFFVSRITNFPDREFFGTRYDEYCGQKHPYKLTYLKFRETDRFYMKYAKETGNTGASYWDH